jgi:transposase
MKSLTNLREAIIRAHNRGRGQQEIADFLGVSQSVVSKAISRFKETGSYEDRPGRGRKKTARNPRNIRRAKGMNQRNPTSKMNSTRKLAKKLGIGKSSVHEILSVDLGLKPFKYQKRQKLTAEAKKKRLDRARALLRRFARGKHKMIIFSDEKLFDIEQVGCLFCCFEPFSVDQSTK